MFLLFLSVTRCFSLILYFPCPTPEISYLPRSSGFFYWRMVLRNQDMSSRCVHCYWDVTTPTSSWWTEPGDVCVYIHTFTFISVCIKDHEFVLIVIQHYSFHSNFLPFCICMSLLQMVPAILTLFTYLINPLGTTNLLPPLPPPEQMVPTLLLNSNTLCRTTPCLDTSSLCCVLDTPEPGFRNT